MPVRRLTTPSSICEKLGNGGNWRIKLLARAAASAQATGCDLRGALGWDRPSHRPPWIVCSEAHRKKAVRVGREEHDRELARLCQAIAEETGLQSLNRRRCR